MNKTILNKNKYQQFNNNCIKLYLKGNTTERIMQLLQIENNYGLDYSTFVYKYNNNLYVSKLITEPEELYQPTTRELKYNTRLLYNEIFSLFYSVYNIVLDKFYQNNIFNVYKDNLFTKKNLQLDKIFMKLSEYIKDIEFNKVLKIKYPILKNITSKSEIENNYKYDDLNLHCFNMNLVLKNKRKCSIEFDHDDIFIRFFEENNSHYFKILQDSEIVKSNLESIKNILGYYASKVYIQLCNIFFSLKTLLYLPKICSNNILNQKSSLYYYKILNDFESLKDFGCILFYKYPEINDNLELKIIQFSNKGSEVCDDNR